MKKFLSFLFVTIAAQSSFAQYAPDARLRDIDIQYADKKVKVPYTIVNGKANDKYFVWTEFYTEKGQKLEAKTLSGDINTITGNGSKTIDWDVKADGLALNEKIYAKVNAKLLPQGNLGKAMVASTVFPGAGDYQFKKGKPYWLKGALAYGLVGGSVAMLGMAGNSYSKYEQSGAPSATDANFAKATQYQQVSLIMAGATVGIWAINYAGTFSKASKYKKMTTQNFMNEPNYESWQAQSVAKLINVRGLAPNLFAELQFTDDNNNGIIEAREKAELTIVISNQGKGDAMKLEVSVADSTTDSFMTMQNTFQKINLIKAGESVKVSIPITTTIDLRSNKHKLAINVTEAFGFDMDPAYLVLNTYAYQPPKLVVSGVEVIDAGPGTNAVTEDGQLQMGETAKAKVVVQNIGQDLAQNTQYSIASNDQNIFFDGELTGTLGDLKPGEVKELYFTLTPNKRIKVNGNLPITITMTEQQGRGGLKNYQMPIALNQKPAKANIVNINANMESLTKDIARFEFTSNKFKANIANMANIKTVPPSITKRPNSVGVVIGIAQYKEMPPAPYADNDATIMKEYFFKVLGVEQVIIYTNEQVSGFFFDDVFNPETGELQKAIVKGETELFVFYSGHGVPDKTGSNVFLFPSDGKVAQLETRGYNIETLYENLTKMGAKHVTVILDACFSGASRTTQKVATENLVGQKGVKIKPRSSWTRDPNFTVITSSTGEETSLGFDASETGLFTYYFAAGLQGKADANGDKTITLGELKQYVITNVGETLRKILGKQTPIFTGDDNMMMATF